MTKTSKLFTAVLLFVSFALCVVMADFVSSFITVGSFSITSQAVTNNEFKIYGISLVKATSVTQADEIANTYKNLNAAGFIWKYDNQFFVMASAYENKNDAEKVRSKLLEQNYNPTILELEFDDISVDGNFSQKEKSNLVLALSLFKNSYANLYDISVALDTSVKTEIEALMMIGDVKTTATKIKSDFDSLFNMKITSKLLQIKLKMGELIENINELVDGEKNNIPLSSRIKYCYFQCLKLYEELGNE